MFCKLSLVGTQSTHECLTFQNTETQTKNNCSLVNEHEQLSNQTYDDMCLECTIFNIDQVPKSNCQQSLTCIKLFFNDNLIFEEFFKKYRHIIEDLYINDINHEQNSTLFVHIKRHNLTEINFSYLNSTFNNRYIQELQPLTIVGNFSVMTISNVIISIPCNASNQTIDYRIHSGKITSTKSIACAMPESINLIYTSKNLTTSLPTQSSSSLLYLFLVFFLITICIIIASIWSFFRQNNIDNHHDIVDECLSDTHKMMNTGKYGVTDKDSKSATSWSHGSALLLSPLVK